MLKKFDLFKVDKAGVFPKICRSCFRQYDSFEDFLAGTRDVSGKSCMAEYPLDDAGVRVGVFRNCTCGSTLLVVCISRRDDSEAGGERRRNFDHIVDEFEKKGIDRETARRELRNVIGGGRSEILESAGFVLA